MAVDVNNAVAFGPRFDGDGRPLAAIHALPGPALARNELSDFVGVLDRLEQDYADDFASGRLAGSPERLWRLYHYFVAVHALKPFRAPRCNAPHISTVIEVDGTLHPCHFLPAMGRLDGQPLAEAINEPDALDLRRAYRTGERPECERCVSPLYRGARSLLSGL